MHRIYPIRNGTLSSTKDTTTYLTDRDVDLVFPVYVFLIRADDGTTILVDTGVKRSDSPYMQENNRTVGPPGGGPEPILDALAEHDLTPADIDYVVLTHLHHDHSSNNQLFPDAEFVVQRIELEAARNPLPIFSRVYPEDNIDSLDDVELTVVDGDHQLIPGVELLLTPGHTDGMQSVIIETENGPHALVSDLAYTRHNLDPSLESILDAEGRTLDVTPSDDEFIPPGIHTDVAVCYESIARIYERIGDDGTIVLSHDPEASEEPYPR